MNIIKWSLFSSGLVVTIGLYWLTIVDQQTWFDISFMIIEKQTSLGFPLWLSGLVPMALGWYIGQKSSKYTPPPRVLNAGPTPKPMQEIPEGGSLSVGSIDESAFMTDWEVHLQSEANALNLPPGATITLQPFHNVQIGLTLRRTTPQNSRLAMVLLAELLSKTKTPPRVRITFIDILVLGEQKKTSNFCQ